MGSTVAFGGKVAVVGRGQVDSRRHLLRHLDPEGSQLSCLVRIVGQQSDAVGAKGGQHLGRCCVVALVFTMAKSQVGFVGVQAGVLEGVGIQL